MVLKIDGDINRYYVQTLCMVFFPGATFGENEVGGEGIPEVSVNVYPDLEGGVTAYVSMKLNDKVCDASASVGKDEVVSIATKEGIAVGRALFSAGKDLLGHIPPWGILTGVRPAKIASALIKGGNGITKSKRILRDEYFLNPQKAALAVSVASLEMKLLKKATPDLCSLYISIPFCPTRCSYCSFVSYTTPRLLSLIDPYVEALMTDLDDTFDTIEKLGLKLSTIYIGGGTPTTLTEFQLEKLLSKISSRVDTETLSEFTLEAGRPDTITKEKLDVAKRYGVTRISVNPQTLNDDILREIGRRHTTEDFFNAYKIAKESGIKDINVDLIAGLPGDDFRNFSETVDKIIELDPTNITVHTFCVKKASDALKNNSNIYSVSGGDPVILYGIDEHQLIALYTHQIAQRGRPPCCIAAEAQRMYSLAQPRGAHLEAHGSGVVASGDAHLRGLPVAGVIVPEVFDAVGILVARRYHHIAEDGGRPVVGREGSHAQLVQTYGKACCGGIERHGICSRLVGIGAHGQGCSLAMPGVGIPEVLYLHLCLSP